jgi:hypothetical protein
LLLYTQHGFLVIDNNAAGCTLRANGCGRLSSPYSTLGAFNAENNGALATSLNPAINDSIFIYESGTEYTGPLTLLNGQKLFGQDATPDATTLATLTGITIQPDSAACFHGSEPCS